MFHLKISIVSLILKNWENGVIHQVLMIFVFKWAHFCKVKQNKYKYKSLFCIGNIQSGITLFQNSMLTLYLVILSC